MFSDIRDLSPAGVKALTLGRQNDNLIRQVCNQPSILIRSWVGGCGGVAKSDLLSLNQWHLNWEGNDVLITPFDPMNTNAFFPNLI